MNPDAHDAPVQPRHKIRAAALSAIVGATMWHSALEAAEPVALVEEIGRERPNLQFMDFLVQGRVIALAATERIVLGYMATCLRETITGGKVTVGRKESLVEGGTVEREEIDCDGGALLLTPAQAQEAGATVFRKPANKAGTALPRAQRIIYGVSPMLRLGAGPATVTITRLDADEKTVSVSLSGRQRDLAQDGVTLAKGGLYVAETATGHVVFKVSAIAESSAPVLARLLAF